MLEQHRRDTLLTVCRIGVSLYIVLSGLVAALVVFAVVALRFFPNPRIAAELAAAPGLVFPVVLFGAALGIATLVLAILFGLQLRRIIGTVRDGDPFDPANADRLTRMAWYSLWATIGNWIVAGVAVYLAQFFDALHARYEAPLGGIVLTATLFILARVFRHGAAMRDDLAGTV